MSVKQHHVFCEQVAAPMAGTDLLQTIYGLLQLGNIGCRLHCPQRSTQPNLVHVQDEPIQGMGIK